MTVANYNSLVQKTFCENAIRSVVMIDDDFLTYSESIRALNNEVDLDYNKIDSSKRAATLESFFQSKNMIFRNHYKNRSLAAPRFLAPPHIALTFAASRPRQCFQLTIDS